MQIQQVFTVNGHNFTTKAEALNFMRRPKVLEALEAFTEGKELAEWLISNEDDVKAAFDIGTISRVTKSEFNALTKALTAIIESDNKDFKFVIDNAEAIKESFRWPTVKRMNDEEKAFAIKNTLVALSNNEELADWIMVNKDVILEAYQAGVEKRQVSPKAAEALAAYRDAKKAEKEAKEAEKLAEENQSI